MIDYYSFPRNKSRRNNIFVVIDCLSKQAISILCYKTATAENIARLYIYYIYRYYKTAESIILDHSGQFIFIFWKEFNRILNT
jgi:hypothetical protein